MQSIRCAAVSAVVLTAAALVAAGHGASAAPAAGTGAGTDTSTDRWGITEIYPTAPGGQTWFLSDDPNNDPRFDPQADLTHNSDGSWRLSDDRARMDVYTSTFDQSDEDRIETDQSELEQRGYMYDEHDWKNVEITGYVKNNDSDPDDDDFDWYARGYRHNDDHPCWGTAYKSQLKYRDGGAGWQKELSHTEGYTNSLPERSPHGSLARKWVGFKAVMYNVPSGVKLSIYADYDVDDAWTKVYDYTDDGGWEIRRDGDNECNGAYDQVITWGGPSVGFRWDNIDSSVDFKDLSVREIDATGGGGSGGDCGAATSPASATATGSDDNTPDGAIDADLSTRWSAAPTPQSITTDLGSAAQLCGVDIAWYRGDERTDDFTVSTSTDGSTFATAYTGTSSGTTTAFEHYPVDGTARYVRVTVSHNSDNEWASISEIAVDHPD